MEKQTQNPHMYHIWQTFIYVSAFSANLHPKLQCFPRWLDGEQLVFRMHTLQATLYLHALSSCSYIQATWGAFVRSRTHADNVMLYEEDNRKQIT